MIPAATHSVTSVPFPAQKTHESLPLSPAVNKFLYLIIAGEELEYLQVAGADRLVPVNTEGGDCKEFTTPIVHNFSALLKIVDTIYFVNLFCRYFVYCNFVNETDE
jgi:hypothetical protein